MWHKTHSNPQENRVNKLENGILIAELKDLRRGIILKLSNY